jgi:predicted thioredoxin/glutaredoxin
MSTKNTDPAQKILNQINALQKGKNVVWSLPVVGKDGKVMPNKIIKVNGKDHINSLKHNQKGMKEVEA